MGIVSPRDTQDPVDGTEFFVMCVVCCFDSDCLQRGYIASGQRRVGGCMYEYVINLIWVEVSYLHAV